VTPSRASSILLSGCSRWWGICSRFRSSSLGGIGVTAVTTSPGRIPAAAAGEEASTSATEGFTPIANPSDVTAACSLP